MKALIKRAIRRIDYFVYAISGFFGLMTVITLIIATIFYYVDTDDCNSMDSNKCDKTKACYFACIAYNSTMYELSNNTNITLYTCSCKNKDVPFFDTYIIVILCVLLILPIVSIIFYLCFPEIYMYIDKNRNRIGCSDSYVRMNDNSIPNANNTNEKYEHTNPESMEEYIQRVANSNKTNSYEYEYVEYSMTDSSYDSNDNNKI